MLYIDKITSNPSQQMNLTGINSITIQMNLTYLPRIQQWMMDVIYQNITIQGIMITAQPNILRQWRNIIPFGICCLRLDGLDPYEVTDFSTQVATLYLLDAPDVASVEAQYYT